MLDKIVEHKYICFKLADTIMQIFYLQVILPNKLNPFSWKHSIYALEAIIFIFKDPSVKLWNFKMTIYTAILAT